MSMSESSEANATGSMREEMKVVQAGATRRARHQDAARRTADRAHRLRQGQIFERASAWSRVRSAGRCASASCSSSRASGRPARSISSAAFPELVTFEVMGEGFTWDVQDRQRDIAAARQAWQRSCEMILDPDYDFVLLDELNIALRNDYLDIAEVVAFLKQRPRDKHVCITGRDAPPRAARDRRPRHRDDAGRSIRTRPAIKAQRGVEF